jgi:hypothetical protein
MIKQIGLIAIVVTGLIVLIPGTNVEANSSHLQSHLHSTSLHHHGAYIAGAGMGIVAIAKFKAHKENPQQIYIK